MLKKKTMTFSVVERVEEGKRFDVFFVQDSEDNVIYDTVYESHELADIQEYIMDYMRAEYLNEQSVYFIEDSENYTYSTTGWDTDFSDESIS